MQEKLLWLVCHKYTTNWWWSDARGMVFAP